MTRRQTLKGLLPLLLAAAAATAPGAALASVQAGTNAQRSNVPGLTAPQYMDAFVKRTSSQLRVEGHPFRFAGANIEYLGLKNYGPNPSTEIPVGSEAYPTKYEIDDALATAHEMGATAIRVQTLGDTIGCNLCEEPKLGQFNAAAFKQTDLLVAEARRYGIKLIGEFDGDANGSAPAGSSNFQGHDWYCIWRKASNCGMAFFTDPTLLGDYERHMKAVLDHVNPLTGLAYKDDPTFLGWVDGNNLDLLDGVPPPLVESWLTKASAYYKSIDPKQLFINISLNGGDADVTPTVLQIPGIDVYAQEYYPHWFPGAQGGDRVDGSAPIVHQEAAQVAAAGKAYTTIEFGWDNTNFLTQSALKQFLDGLQADPNVVGDGFWALEGHASGHGWEPIPANAGCSPTCEGGEDGNWWALYYTGVPTLSNEAADMAARAQLLRGHAYAMSRFPKVPSHERVPAPIITSTTGGKVLFAGAAGSRVYTIQKVSARGSWITVCDRCTTDSSGGWSDPVGGPGCYRVTGYNLDGITGPASSPAGTGCPTPQTRTCSRARTVTVYLSVIPQAPIKVLVDGRRVKTRRRGHRVTFTLARGTPVRERVVIFSGHRRLRHLLVRGCRR